MEQQRRRPSAVGPSEIWRATPLNLALRVVSFLPQNEVACNARGLCRASAEVLSKPEHKKVDLSKPVPHEAFFARWGTPGAVRDLTFEKRKQLVYLTAASGGHPANLIVALGASGFSPNDPFIFEAAAQVGCLETCQLLWPLDGGISMKDRGLRMMVAAARAGKSDICVWLHKEHEVPWDDSKSCLKVMDDAANAGHLHLCCLMHEQYGVPYTEGVLVCAARKGDLALCDSLQRQQGFRVTAETWSAVFRAAAEERHTPICMGLLATGRISFLNALTEAASVGWSQLLDQLLDNTKSYAPSKAPVVMASKGKASKHKMHSDTAPVDWWHLVLPAAAMGCDLNTLQALFQCAFSSTNGADLRLNVGERSLILAQAINSRTADWQEKAEWLMVEQGLAMAKEDVHKHVAVLRSKEADHPKQALARLVWLQQKGMMSSPMAARVQEDVDFLCSVVSESSGAILEACLDGGTLQGDPSAAGLLRAATKGGHWQALLLLHRRGYEVAATDVADLVRSLSEEESLEISVMEALLTALGPKLVLTPEVTASGARSGNVAVMSWLLAHGCLLNAAVFEAAAASGSEDMMEWVAAHGCPRPETSDKVYCEAAERGDLQTLRCLVRLSCGKPRGVFDSVYGTSPLPVLTWMVEQQFPFDPENAEWNLEWSVNFGWHDQEFFDEVTDVWFYWVGHLANTDDFHGLVETNRSESEREESVDVEGGVEEPTPRKFHLGMVSARNADV